MIYNRITDTDAIERERYLLADLLWFIKGQLALDADESPFQYDHTEALGYAIQLTKEEESRIGAEATTGMTYRQAIKNLSELSDKYKSLVARNHDLLEQLETLRGEQA